MMPRQSISVVVSVLHCSRVLDRVLPALDFYQRDCAEIECIVVEDGCDRSVAAALAPTVSSVNLTVLRNHMPVGRSMSRNRGWRAASGHWIVFLDGDLIPDPGWLEAYCRAFDSGAPDVVLGANYYDPQPHSKRGACASDIRGPVPASGWAHSFKGSNFSIRRELLIELHGFAPCLARGDEIDFGIRLAELSPTVLVAGDARACETRSPASDGREWTDAEFRALVYRNPVKAAVVLGLREWSRTAEIAEDELNPSSCGWRRLLTLLPPDAVPGTFASLPNEMVSYFSERAGVDEAIVSSYIEDAVARGLVVRESRGNTYCDLFHTANWLRAKTRYLEHELENAAFARTHPTPRQRGDNEAEPLTVHCRGRYTVKLDLEPGLCWDDMTVNLCIPVAHSCQSNVNLTSLSPPDLAAHVDKNNGLIANIPASWAAHEGTLGYEFECDVLEGCFPQSEARTAGDDRGFARPRPEHLRFAYPAAYQQKAKALLEYILDGVRWRPEDDVRRIYCWIVENLSYAPTELPDESILDSGIGTCVHLARLFINLARLRGVPARERCGALMARSTSDSEVVTVGIAHSLFSHTWAEVYLDGRGWCGVDFVVTCYGKWQTNSFSVGGELRSALAVESERLLEYYFGNVDPYRIYASSCANMIPPLMAGRSGRNRRVRDELMVHMHHRLACVISTSGGLEAKP